MHTLKYHFTGVSPLMFGTKHNEQKQHQETHDQFEQRTWKHKVRQDENGQVYIAPFALKNALEDAGKRLQMKLTGKSTYTKLFVQGTLVTKPLLLFRMDGKPVTIDDVKPVTIFSPVGGQRGDKRRVDRIFPELRNWQCDAEIELFDDRLTDEIVRRHVEEIGMYIGFGSMRVANGGINGRFSVK